MGQQPGGGLAPGCAQHGHRVGPGGDGADGGAREEDAGDPVEPYNQRLHSHSSSRAPGATRSAKWAMVRLNPSSHGILGDQP